MLITLFVADSEIILTELVERHLFERTAYLKESKRVEIVYEMTAEDDQFIAFSAEDEVDHHYICLVKFSDYLFELNDDREESIKRDFLDEDDVSINVTADVINKYIKSDKNEQFSLLALMKCIW